MKHFPVSEGLTDFTTRDIVVPIPNEPELRQLVWGALSDLGKIENYDEELDFDYRFALASFFVQLFLDYTNAAVPTP